MSINISNIKRINELGCDIETPIDFTIDSFFENITDLHSYTNRRNFIKKVKSIQLISFYPSDAGDEFVEYFIFFLSSGRSIMILYSNYCLENAVSTIYTTRAFYKNLKKLKISDYCHYDVTTDEFTQKVINEIVDEVCNERK